MARLQTEDGSYDLDRIERTAYYQCENADCHAHLTEADKLEMVRNGVWKDTNPKPFPAEFRSYHISALYSFNITWGGMAKLFLLSKDDPGKLRNFYNSYLGECFAQQAATVRREDVDALIKASNYYLKGELLRKPECILMAADTQGSCFWYAVEAVYEGGSSSLIDWGEAATFEDLEEVSKRQYKVRSGEEEYYSIYKAVIDLRGNRTTQVYDFCIKTGFRFIPVAGSSAKQGLFSPIRETTIPYKNYNIPALLLDDKQFKDLLYISIIKERSGKLSLPSNCDDELKLQLSSERLIQRKNSTEWVCSNRRNHMGDCCKYLEAFKYRLEPTLKAKREAEKLAAANLPTPRQYTLSAEVRPYVPVNEWN